MKWHTLPERKAPLAPTRRQRDILVGAPLVLIPAIFAFPAWIVLVHQPRFAHSEALGVALFAVFAFSSIAGVRKLLRCFSWREFDLIGALAIGILLVLGVMLLYVAMFFLVTWLGDVRNL